MPRVLVLDSTLREGEQAAGVSLTPEKKLRLAAALDRAGVDMIELGHPGAAPDVDRAIGLISSANLRAELVVHARACDEDLERAAHLPVDRLALFLATSPVHLEAKLRITRSEALRRVSETVAAAASTGKRVRFAAEDALRTDPGFLVEIAAAAVEAGADRIGLPDTVGIARPDEVRRTFRRVRRALPLVGLDAHCHDDLGLAVANTLAAVEGGATCVHVSVNGLGERCGLAAMAPVVMALRLLYKTLTVRPDALTELSAAVQEMSGLQVWPLEPVVGSSAFTHCSGVHTAGVTRAPATYEPYDPELLGRGRDILLGKLAGRAAVTWRLGRLGVHITPDVAAEVAQLVKQRADSPLSDDELLALAHSVQAHREPVAAGVQEGSA